jgi:5-methylcytosine-specific restriction endonuclease McrA
MSKRRHISEKVRRQVYDKFNGHCAYCGCMIQYNEMQVDHFAPVHFFGDNIKEENLMPACQACNKYKSSKIEDNSSAGIAETTNLFSPIAEKNRGIKSFENTAQTSSAF